MAPMSNEPPGRIQIGRVLKEARARAGLDIRTVEERTKIRTVYLRALEDEEWEALPNPAYAKGFLRTYAALVGLDAEALVDEFRRQVEGGGEGPTYPLAEGVLERRRRYGEGSPGPGLGIAIAVVLIVAGGLALIGLIGDDGEPRGERRGLAQQPGGRGESRGGGERSGKPGDSEPFTLALAVSAPVEICLLDESERELIDGQVLAAGSEESFTARGFELRFPRGYGRTTIDLSLDGKPRPLPRAGGPAAFGLRSPKGLERSRPPGLECP